MRDLIDKELRQDRRSKNAGVQVVDCSCLIEGKQKLLFAIFIFTAIDTMLGIEEIECDVRRYM